MNTFGHNLTLTDFGESHGKAMGGIIDGLPAGFHFDLEEIQREVDRRRPGTSSLVSPRQESDMVEFLSGLTEDGVSLGTPVGFLVRNRDHRSSDYDAMKGKFRPNHADFTYWKKYGILDWRGGGRASARQTLSRVVAGAFARQILRNKNIHVAAWLSQVGKVSLCEKYPAQIPVTPTPEMEEEIKNALKEKDSVGGMVSCRVTGMPAGIGEPVYGKLHARLAEALMGINGAMMFEYGEGGKAASRRGSEMLDILHPNDSGTPYLTNHCGGINGGISNGSDLLMSVAFKPTPTLSRALPTIDTEGQESVIQGKGRHDPCIAVRAVPVVEAMVCLTLADLML